MSQSVAGGPSPTKPAAGGASAPTKKNDSSVSGGQAESTNSDPKSTPKVSGAQARAAQKESAAIERRLGKLSEEQSKLSEQMSMHDPADYAGLADLGQKQQALQDQIDELEMRWLELSELLG